MTVLTRWVNALILAKRCAWAWPLALCAACMLSACQPKTDAHTLVVAVAQAPITLDPRLAADAASERINRLLYQRLVAYDAQSRVVPSLADWRQGDALHVRLVLRTPAHFHDGQPLTARDVKATYDSLRQMPASPHAAEFANIAAIHTPDAQTIDFSLKQPDALFVSRLMVGILPARLLAAGHDFAHQPVGSGPFKFVSWSSALELQRVTDGLRVRFEEVKDPNVRVLKLKRGEADVLQGDLPPELVGYLQRQPHLTVNTGPGANFSYLGINTQSAFLKDVRVRQALAYAIDTQAIVRKVLVPHSRSATALLPPEHYAGNPQLQPYAYDPARARRLLQAAGVRLPLTLVYKTSTDAQRIRLATILQAQMAPAGITLQIKSLDWGTFFSDVQRGQFQLYGLTWVGIHTPEIYRQVFASDQWPPTGLNRGRYQDAELDTLLEQADWPAVTQRLHSQLPIIPLWYEGQFVAYGKRIKQFAPTPEGDWDGLMKVDFKP